MPEAHDVRDMFARIARRYDRANHLLSVGLDRSWRRAAVEFAGVMPGETALDVCAGTGDLTIDLARAGAHAVGSDFCSPMLDLAYRKVGDAADWPRFIRGDTLRLPFKDGQFDLVTVAFGIRNVSDPLAGLQEMHRVVRPGGRVLVLEFCKPRIPVLRSVFGFYFRRILPRIGGWITGDRNAFSYLERSVSAFREREDFLALMGQAGLQSTQQKILTGGVAALYLGQVPS